MTRDLDRTVALRARLGLAFGENSDWLGYATAGAARGRIENSFATSNAANAFPQSGGSDANGYQVGLGIERKVLENFSVGLEYLYTSLKDDEFRVRAAPGTAPPTNPFLLVNPAGTDFRRSDEDFEAQQPALDGHVPLLIFFAQKKRSDADRSENRGSAQRYSGSKAWERLIASSCFVAFVQELAAGRRSHYFQVDQRTMRP